MIIRDKLGPLQLMFALRGSVLPHIAAPVLFVALWSAALVLVDRHLLPMPHANSTPFAFFSVALSLFLGFRNNAAYDRWWEARRLWGALISDSRNLARELDLFLPNSPIRQDILRLMLAFLHLHRAHLRELPHDATVNRLVADCNLSTRVKPLVPDLALDAIIALLATERSEGRLDGFGALTLSNRLAGIATTQSACERIRTTPLPYAYSLMIFRTSWLYVLLLPFALLAISGWLTPLFTVIVAYTFFGFAQVAEELAHPFGSTANSLPLDALCRLVEISLAPHLGEPVPEPLHPRNFRLD